MKPRTTPGMTPIVYILDDDVRVRESLGGVVVAAGLSVATFASAQAFLDRPRAQRPSCLVLDIGLPDLSGLEVQERIAVADAEMPVIFLTGTSDIPTIVRAMKAGAAEFLTKPFAPETALAAIETALARSRELLWDKVALQDLRSRHATLSVREQEVMALVVRGRLNKQIGGALGISEITVKAHRGRMMRKMCARSLAELVTMAARLELTDSYRRLARHDEPRMHSIRANRAHASLLPPAGTV